MTNGLVLSTFNPLVEYFDPFAVPFSENNIQLDSEATVAGITEACSACSACSACCACGAGDSF
jgi:hypothetical protein